MRIGLGTACSVYLAYSSRPEDADTLSSVSGGDEMNLVLLKLVEYLGHTNALLSGLAFDEVSIRIVR